MNHLNSTSSDDGCSMIEFYDRDASSTTPHCTQRSDDTSSPPPLLPKKIVSPLTTSRPSMLLLAVENKQQLLTFSNITKKGGMRKDRMSPSSSSSSWDVDMEIMELHNNHHSSDIPMFPVEALDDIMDGDGCPPSHEEPPGDSSSSSSSTTTTTRTIIYLQPRVPIHGCKIPPIDPSRARRHHLEHENDRNDHDMLLARRPGVPTFKDLGLLPMPHTPLVDHEEFGNGTINTSTPR